jgi:hypothetical protein
MTGKVSEFFYRMIIYMQGVLLSLSLIYISLLSPRPLILFCSRPRIL